MSHCSVVLGGGDWGVYPRIFRGIQGARETGPVLRGISRTAPKRSKYAPNTSEYSGGFGALKNVKKLQKLPKNERELEKETFFATKLHKKVKYTSASLKKSQVALRQI